jgi:Arc/MetJ-type ribon-helix-helix transcriptional regulator
MKERISATVDKKTVDLIDEILLAGKYRNKSHVIEDAIENFAEDLKNE